MKWIIKRLTWATVEQACELEPLTRCQVFWRFIFGPREGIRSWKLRQKWINEHPTAVEAERDKYKAVVEGLLAWNADSFEDYNPGPNQDSHSTRWVCPVCQTTDEHEDGCPVEAAEQARRSFTNAESQGVQDG